MEERHRQIETRQASRGFSKEFNDVEICKVIAFLIE